MAQRSAHHAGLPGGLEKDGGSWSQQLTEGYQSRPGKLCPVPWAALICCPRCRTAEPSVAVQPLGIWQKNSCE